MILIPKGYRSEVETYMSNGGGFMTLKISKVPKRIYPAGYVISITTMEGDGERYNKGGWHGLSEREFLFLHELLVFLEYQEISDNILPTVASKYEELWEKYPEAKERFSPKPEFNTSLEDYIRDSLFIDKLGPYEDCSSLYCSIDSVEYLYFEGEVFASHVRVN